MLYQSKKRRKEWYLTVIILLGICVSMTAGCDKYARYKVLTFFFTGVPPLHEEEDLLVEMEVTVSPSTQKEKKSRGYTHGPYAAEQCYHCHVTKQKKRLKPSEYAGGFPSFGDLPGKLLMPVKDLCVDCHTTKTDQYAFSRNLWIHGPVASGRCTICHHHHSSRADYMLKKNDSVELCTQCHAEGLILDISVHTKGEQCTMCHNAHVGRDRLLLKKDYNEIY